jgi:hypothetical protein
MSVSDTEPVLHRFRGNTNLMLTVEEELLRRARIRALGQGTSVNAVVRDYLEHYVGAAGRAGIAGFLEIAGRARASSGSDGRSWSRDELHAR